MLKKLFTRATLIRTLSSILLVIVALVTLIAGGNLLFATMLAVSLIGQYELYRVISMQKSLLGFSGYLATGGYYLLLFLDLHGYSMPLILAFLIVLMAVYVFSFPRYKAGEICHVYFGFFYVSVMISYVYQIRELTNGVFLVFLIFLSSWICDTCAYLVGVMAGKHKLAPKLSPNKSIEGSIGGIVGAVLLGALYGGVFCENLAGAFRDPSVGCAIVCGLGAVISQIGDLAASGIKRNYEKKDYGHLIPGHGGIMDRFDSVIFVAPAIYFLIQYIK